MICALPGGHKMLATSPQRPCSAMCMLTSQKRREHPVPAGFLTNSGYARRRTANRAARAYHTHRSNSEHVARTSSAHTSNAAQPPPHNISERARQPASSKMIEQPSARKEPCGSNSLNEQRAQSQQAACTARTNTRSPNDKRTQPETERTAARRSN